MKEILLDTNFIASCIRYKIDFFEKLELGGYKILIPKQVIQELKNITNSNKKKHFKEDAELALRILQKNDFSSPGLGKGHVDKSIIKYAKEHPKTIIATIDRELQFKISNRVMIIRNRAGFEII